MNIYDAAMMAKAEGLGMYRREYVPEHKIIPTDELDGCVVICEVNPYHFEMQWWKPRMADLLAADWDVCPLPSDALIARCISLLQGKGGDI